MKKNLRGITAIAFLFFGIGITLLLKPEKKKLQPEEKGIYYEPLVKEASLGNPNRGTPQYSYSALYYNDKIYTSPGRQLAYDNFSLEEYTELFDSLPLEELTEVYGIEAYWTTDKADLYKVQNNGKLYKIQGCPDSRLCLCYSSEILQAKNKPECSYDILIFDCLNGIYLEHGKDLYQGKLNLEYGDIQEAYAGHYSDHYEVPYEERIEPALIEHKKDIFSSFFSSLYEGEFVAKEDAAGLIGNNEEFIKWEFILNNCDGYFLIKDSYGTDIEIYISPAGYAIFFSPESTPFITKIDKQICKQIISQYF